MNKITYKNLIIAAVVIGVLVIPGVIVYMNKGESGGSFLTSQEAGDKALKYINDNFLQGKEQASLISIELKDQFYKLRLKAQDEEFDAYMTKDGKSLFFQEPINLDQKASAPAADNSGTSSTENELTLGSFSYAADEEVCKENGKPVVYFFGSSTCPHCLWEHPVLQKVVSNFGDKVVFHENIDSDDDSEIFSKYSPGYVPALILGCKYFRVGSGEQFGEEEESNNLTALICKLTDNQPSGVCGSVQDLIDQAK